ncbi:MAG: deoxyguanosinetriphosphate triphosphohydrolase [Butyricicoccaceae bacterium]
MREWIEQQEKQNLCSWATLAQDSRGREQPLEPCALRTCFQRDRDRILHCKSFRRLGNKTQVFISPEGDHYRARLTHTLEVTQIARTIARALRLNEDLAEAIAMGHDLGHTPFGHVGERVLDQLCGFRHNEQSLRIVECLERNGAGLNLTWEVRDGIVCHTGSRKAQTPEGRLVHFADRIAYVNHDIDDAIRAGLIDRSDLPQDCIRLLGETHGERIDTMIADMVRYGEVHQEIGMNEDVHEAMMGLREFLFRTVYRRAMDSRETERVAEVLTALYRYFMQHIGELPEYYKKHIGQDGEARSVCDYIAGMTDRFAISTYSELFIPHCWNIK